MSCFPPQELGPNFWNLQTPSLALHLGTANCGTFENYEAMRPQFDEVSLLRCLTARQREVDRYLRVHFYRFAVQNVRPVTPLLHGINGRLVQQRRSGTQDVQVLNGPIFADDGSQNHGPLYAGDLRHLRIGRVNVLNFQTLGHAGRNAHALRSGYFWNGRWRRTDNSADNSVHLTAGHSAGNAADNAHIRRGSFFFFDYLHLLWNLGGRAKLVIDDVSLYLLHHLHSGRWWRWRGRGRGRCQKCHGHRFGQSFREHQRNQDHDSDDDDLHDKRDGGRLATRCSQLST